MQSANTLSSVNSVRLQQNPRRVIVRRISASLLAVANERSSLRPPTGLSLQEVRPPASDLHRVRRPPKPRNPMTRWWHPELTADAQAAGYCVRRQPVLMSERALARPSATRNGAVEWRP